MNARISQAAALHRQAAAIAAAAAAALEDTAPATPDPREQHELAEQLRAAAAALTPGWLGAQLDAQFAHAPLGGPGPPGFVRVGVAQPLDDVGFPAIVPLLGTGHLTIDADCRDPRVAGLVRSLLLRLLAAAPTGSLLVRAVAAAAAGRVFAPFAPLGDAGLMPPPAVDQAGLRAVLTEAEQWIRPPRPGSARRDRHNRTLLLVVAALPELTGAADLARLGTLARHGPEAGLHLIVAGWPPPPLTPETTHPPLPRATMISMRNPYALVGDPPGGSFADPARGLPGAGLNAPVFLDTDPPARLLEQVCRDLTARLSVGSRPTLTDLLPGAADGLWTESATAGLTTTVGYDGDTPVTLRFNELTPHWLVGGCPGAGKTSFLTNVVLGLCARYPPAELALRVISFSADPPGADPLRLDDAVGIRLPHLPPVDGAAPTDAVAVLRDLVDELDRRVEACQAAGVARLAELPVGAMPGATAPPRLLCVIDGLHALSVEGYFPDGGAALPLLAALAHGGRNHGIHLLLCGEPVTVGDPAASPKVQLGQRLSRPLTTSGAATSRPGPMSGAATSRPGAMSGAATSRPVGMGTATSNRSVNSGAPPAARGAPADAADDGPAGGRVTPAGGGWDAIYHHLPVRVALPGGGPVLEPMNDSAAGLPLGAAVINTAGGLGGPRGATRGHERVVRFPDPGTAPEVLRHLGDRLREISEPIPG